MQIAIGQAGHADQRAGADASTITHQQSRLPAAMNILLTTRLLARTLAGRA
jgi:hypothetical protein